jgi:hypothetical protein
MEHKRHMVQTYYIFFILGVRQYRILLTISFLVCEIRNVGVGMSHNEKKHCMTMVEHDAQGILHQINMF